LVAAGLMNLHACATLPNAVREMAIPQRRYAKTACIDGVWSTIGSTNLDWRSFLHNDEINVVILGRGFAVRRSLRDERRLLSERSLLTGLGCL
jgi:hypothetical protein